MRLRVNSWKSTLTTGINNSTTTIDGLDVGGFNLPTVASPDYLVIIIDPQATEGLPEIVHLTAHTSGNASGTVVRGAEGSTALAHSAGIEILVGPTVADFDGLLAYLEYWPGGTASFHAAGTALTDIDATNLAINFFAPASGSVVVELSSLGSGNPGDSALFWGLREGSSNLTAPANITANIAAARANCRFLITGLTPGASHTYKWAAAVSYAGGPGTTYWGGSNGPASMSVTAAP